MATRKFLVALEIEIEAGTPEEAAEEFVRRVRGEGSAFQVDVQEDRGEDAWIRIGRRIVKLEDVEAG
jgi:hypothetical protein